MRLKKIEVLKYKRFREPQVLHAGGKLTAVVGPNEAGKTSLLRAIAHLSNDEPFQATGDGTEVSRGADVEDTDILVEALFAIEERDLEALKDLRGASEIRWFYLGRRANGRVIRRVEPRPTRDLSPRKRLRRQLERLQGSKWLQILDDETSDLVFERMDQVAELLAGTKESLEETAVTGLQDLASALREHGLIDCGPQYGRDVLRQLEVLISDEKSPPPARQAEDHLMQRARPFCCSKNLIEISAQAIQ